MTPHHPPASDPDGTDPWRLARRVGAQLAVWSAFSVVAGGLMAWAATALAPGDAAVTLRAAALQFVVWGAIDGAIATFGERDRRRRLARGEGGDPTATRAFGARLQRLLRLNAGLDVLYVAAGIALIVAWRSPAGLGHGLGVVIQGGFLLAFDAWHGFRSAPVAATGERA